jgi:phosphatidylglycerophosphate synthase
VREYRAYQVVRAITVSRLIAGLLLPICAVYEWWSFAAALFIVAVLSDMLDGELARFWGVTGSAGARLDTHADMVLTLGAMMAVSLGGVWYWWLTWVLVALAVFARWLESRLSGDALFMLILTLPAMNFLLISLLAAKFLQLSGDVHTAVSLSFAVLVWVVIALLKRVRVMQFLRDAFARSFPRR